MSNEKTFDSFIIKDVLNNNAFGIDAVVDLATLRSTYFEREFYQRVASYIKEGNLSAIDDAVVSVGNMDEFLIIMRFKDQVGQKYIVTVYDSLELSQNPEVIEIFPDRFRGLL